MNRQQRRRMERRSSKQNGTPPPPDNLSHYLREPDNVVRRKELLGIVDKLIRLHELRKIRNRWHNRLRRWLDGRINGRGDGTSELVDRVYGGMGDSVPVGESEGPGRDDGHVPPPSRLRAYRDAEGDSEGGAGDG